MRRVKFILAFLFGVTFLASAGAQNPACHDNKPADKPNDPLAAAFERLKGLVGEWEPANTTDEALKGKTALVYRLTGGGSALAETIFPGTNMEMLSVYHRDGDQLLMTHYCAAGNQPRMKGKIGKDKDELIFEFAGGTNFDAAKDMHIHDGVIRFVDADHIHSEWEYYANGKAAGKHAFDLVRKKK